MDSGATKETRARDTGKAAEAKQKPGRKESSVPLALSGKDETGAVSMVIYDDDKTIRPSWKGRHLRSGSPA